MVGWLSASLHTGEVVRDSIRSTAVVIDNTVYRQHRGRSTGAFSMGIQRIFLPADHLENLSTEWKQGLRRPPPLFHANLQHASSISRH